MQELSGKVAVVTGAASGIGEAMARRFAAENMRVVLADIERDALARVAADLVLDAIREERFYVLTHPDGKAMIRQRLENILEGRTPALATLA